MLYLIFWKKKQIFGTNQALSIYKALYFKYKNRYLQLTKTQLYTKFYI